MVDNKFIIFIIALLIYAIIIQYRHLAYFIPNKIIKYTPNDFNINYIEYNIHNLNGWLFINPNSDKNNKNKNLLIFFHGNAGNISNRISIIKTLLNILTFTDIFIYDYPQFGVSKGKLTISNIVSSGYRIYDYWCKNRKKLKYKNISMIGESIGTGVMSEVLDNLFKFKHECMPKNIIHLNGITSLKKTVGTILPNIIHPVILPWIDEFNPEKIYIKHIIKLPNLIIIHTPDDEIIPINLVNKFLHKIRLARSVHFIEISGSHNDVIIDSVAIQKIKSSFVI